jgi:hypothetical protein
MGKNKKKKNHQKRKSNHKKNKEFETTTFLPEAGPGCYIARRDLSPDWVIEWEDVDSREFEDDEIPDVAIDTEEHTLSLCNVQNYTQIAYITVYDTRILDARGRELTQGSTTDNQGNTNKCITFIVLCPSSAFVHLCFLEVPKGRDIIATRIESDVREWQRHPSPTDEHPKKLAFPLEKGPFLCTQSENGTLTHFFSGNLHAIDFACAIGTPLLAVADGTVVEARDSNTLTGVAVSNLFEWNSVLIKIDGGENKDTTRDLEDDPLYVEYVHIQKSLVKAGDRVTKGQVIGASGNVGFSPEPHLHFSAFRSGDPEAPTVRVRFQSTEDDKGFLPEAGNWYDAKGEKPNQCITR